MRNLSRTRAVVLPGLVLLLGIAIAVAGADEGAGTEKQDEAQAMTAQTRRRIATLLLVIAQDPEETMEARIAAIHSLHTYMLDKGSKLPDGILEVALNEKEKPKLRIVAATVLIAFSIDELSDKEKAALSGRLWKDAVAIHVDVRGAGAWEDNQRIRAWAVSDLVRLKSSPPDIEAIRLLGNIANNQWGPTSYPGMEKENLYPATGAGTLLETLQETKQGVRLLIASMENQKAKYMLLRHRLLTLLKETVPQTEGIAQVLLEAASHAEPDIRAAAIEALGNEAEHDD